MKSSKPPKATSQPKGALLTKCIYSDIFQQVTTALKELPCSDVLSNDIHTLTYAAEQVEELLSQTPNKGINKMELIGEIITQYFGLTAVEKTEVMTTLQFLYDNENVSIKTTCSLIGNRVMSWMQPQK